MTFSPTPPVVADASESISEDDRTLALYCVAFDRKGVCGVIRTTRCTRITWSCARVVGSVDCIWVEFRICAHVLFCDVCVCVCVCVCVFVCVCLR